MRILIADDEILVRIGLRIVLERCNRQYEIIEAIDGEDAIEKFRTFRPFLAIVDINMPKLDGLAFIERAKKIGTAVFVVLTCHSDFHLMKKAIRIGVQDYIMKTEIDDEELANLAREAEDQICIAEQSGEQIDHGLSRNMLEDELVKAADGRDFDGSKFSEQVGTRKIREPVAILTGSVKRIRSLPEEQYSKLAAGVIHVVKGLLEEYGGGLAIEHSRNEFIVLASFEHTAADGRLVNSAEEFAHRIVLAVESYFNRKISLGVCICADFGQLPRSLQRARDARKNSFFVDGGGWFFYRKGKRRTETSGAEELGQAFASALNAHEYDVCGTLIKEYSARVSGRDSIDADDVLNTLAEVYYLTILHIEAFYPSRKSQLTNRMIGINLFSSCDDLYEITDHLRTVLQKSQDLIRVDTVDHHRDLVQRAQAYIESHISDDISLDLVADQVHLSATYFSRVFRETAGSTFIRYTIKERIEKAKGYINDGEKISVVAAMVGYSSYNYFSRLFKSETGMTPSEYRKAHRSERAASTGDASPRES